MTYQMVVGFILSLLGLLGCIFPSAFANVLSTSRNVGARSLKEKFGEQKGKKITIIWSIIILILGLIAIFTAI